MTTQDALDWCWEHPLVLVMLGLYISSAPGCRPAKGGITRRGREAGMRRWDNGNWTGGKRDGSRADGGPGNDGRR